MTTNAIIDLIMRVLRALGIIKPDTPTPPLPDDPAPEPPQSTDRILFPTGMIQTRMPNGAASIPWSQIARWEPLFTKAVTEGGYTYHPLLLALFAVVESRGNQYTTGQMTGTRDQVVPGMGDPRSKGLLQIRLDLHQANAPQWDGMTPEGNIRLGALLLDRWMKDEGSWEAALSHKWHPGTDPASGVTREEYIRFIREAIAEVKKVWPQEPGTPARVNPFTKPIIYDLANDFGMYGISSGEAWRIINSRFENRDGGAPKYIVNHIQDGTTPGSLQWWARGAGVQASSTVMANRDGSILRIVPEQHGPWTNGDSCSPTPKSAGLRALGGNPNQWSLTLEAEGKPGVTSVSYTDAQLRAICWQFADWMIRYHLPLANVLSHASINQCSRSQCPGEANMLRVLDELKKAGFA